MRGQPFRLLAGPHVESAKLPLTTSFLAMYALSQTTENGISALEMGRKLCVNDSNP